MNSFHSRIFIPKHTIISLLVCCYFMLSVYIIFYTQEENLTLFYQDSNYIYNATTCSLTVKELLFKTLIFWFSGPRLLMLSLCLYLHISIMLLYYLLRRITIFSIIDNTNIVSIITISFIKNGAFCNLIPAFSFWFPFIKAVISRYRVSMLNFSISYNMFTFYQGKKFKWSQSTISESSIEQSFETALSKQITITSTIENSQLLPKFYKQYPLIEKYKTSYLGGNLTEQHEYAKNMSNFELQVALNTQCSTWMSLFNNKSKNLHADKLNTFLLEPSTKTYIRENFILFEKLFSTKLSYVNNILISNKNIEGFTFFLNASNLNKFHLSQEKNLNSDFLNETPHLFKNRVKQTFDKLLEINQACNIGFENSLLFAPSERSIRADNYVVEIPPEEINSTLTKLTESFPNEVRFSKQQLKPLFFPKKITSVDVTQGFQREAFTSSNDLKNFMSNIVLENKFNPLLTKHPDLLINNDYLIAAEFRFFKSNVSLRDVEESIDSIKNTASALNGNARLAIDIKCTIINDVWNL